MFSPQQPTDEGPDDGTPLVPLHEVLSALNKSECPARIVDGVLVTDHGSTTTRVTVRPAPPSTPAIGPAARAVVSVIAPLPKVMQDEWAERPAELAAKLNHVGVLGAVTSVDGQLAVVARLTVYEGEAHAWSSLHAPLLTCAVAYGCEPLLWAVIRSWKGEPGETGVSPWIPRDFLDAQAMLSRSCVCSVSDFGLTAEFGLEAGAVSAMQGHRTALWELDIDEIHPDVGAGMFCLLTMPHHVANADRRIRLCAELNERDFAAVDLPPHFGAWRPGDRPDSIAYSCFLPNMLHAVRGIACNVSTWAMLRARWADGQLAGLGVH
jgi:hypothetical protein